MAECGIEASRRCPRRRRRRRRRNRRNGSVCVAKPADRGIPLVGGRVVVGSRRAGCPDCRVGRLHADSVTPCCVQAGLERNASGEVGTVAGLAGAETGSVLRIRRCLGCGSVLGRDGPAGRMPELSMAERAVEAAGGGTGWCRWRRWSDRRIRAGCVAERADRGIERIGRVVVIGAGSS